MITEKVGRFHVEVDRGFVLTLGGAKRAAISLVAHDMDTHDDSDINHEFHGVWLLSLPASNTPRRILRIERRVYLAGRPGRSPLIDDVGDGEEWTRWYVSNTFARGALDRDVLVPGYDELSVDAVVDRAGNVGLTDDGLRAIGLSAWSELQQYLPAWLGLMDRVRDEARKTRKRARR